MPSKRKGKAMEEMKAIKKKILCNREEGSARNREGKNPKTKKNPSSVSVKPEKTHLSGLCKKEKLSQGLGEASRSKGLQAGRSSTWGKAESS